MSTEWKNMKILIFLPEHLTRHQAIEWGPKGVRSVCVAPGPIGDTEGMRRLSKLKEFQSMSFNDFGQTERQITFLHFSQSYASFLITLLRSTE